MKFPIFLWLILTGRRCSTACSAVSRWCVRAHSNNPFLCSASLFAVGILIHVCCANLNPKPQNFRSTTSINAPTGTTCAETATLPPDPVAYCLLRALGLGLVIYVQRNLVCLRDGLIECNILSSFYVQFFFERNFSVFYIARCSD